MQELTVGTHLATPRWGYTHHGIYAGDGRVIHYAGFSRALRRGPVEEVSLERFTRGRGFRILNVAAPKFAGAAAVDRARQRLGEDRYRLWSNNCEHFANWCLFGESCSRQVDRWRARLPAALRTSLDRRTAGRGESTAPAARTESLQMQPA